jgi:hypothetical protein
VMICLFRNATIEPVAHNLLSSVPPLSPSQCIYLQLSACQSHAVSVQGTIQLY